MYLQYFIQFQETKLIALQLKSICQCSKIVDNITDKYAMVSTLQTQPLHFELVVSFAIDYTYA